MHQLKHNII